MNCTIWMGGKTTPTSPKQKELPREWGILRFPNQNLSQIRQAPKGSISKKALLEEDPKESSPHPEYCGFFQLWKFHPLGLWPKTESWKLNIQQQPSCRTLEGRGLVKAMRGRGPQEQSFTSYRSQCFFMFVICLVISNGLMARPLVLSNEILPSFLQGKKKWRYQKGFACTSRAQLPILATAAMHTKDQWNLNYMLQG